MFSERIARKAEKERIRNIKISEKIERSGYSEQFKVLSNLGFEDMRQSYKALKYNKGDLIEAIKFLQNKEISYQEKGKKDWKEKRYLKEKKGKEEEEFTETKTFEGKIERDDKRPEGKMERMLAKLPSFGAFNQKMQNLGYTDVRKNYQALKKKEGDEAKAQEHIHLKKIMETLVTKETIKKGEYSRVVVDCNNCFYIDQPFLTQAQKGNFKELEEKMATRLTLFQSVYGNDVDIIMVFDNSKLMKDNEKASHYLSKNFKMMNAKPQYNTADDLMVDFASKQSAESLLKTLFVTSDRMLQARLVDKNGINIIASKVFFKALEIDDLIGNKGQSTEMQI